MKQLMKGNFAMAEGAIRAGCRMFAGYPITPQTEILEYLSSHMAEAGGQFVQTESELAGINMIIGAAAAGQRAMTSSSGPGFSLKQEGISYLASMELPAVIVDVMRYGIGLGNVVLGQADYFQATKGGGHGGYKLPVYAPASVQENVDLMFKAFDTAEAHRTPVIILSDADQDGMHIRCILLTFFFRYMRELINNGNVYIGMPPLYKVYKKDIVEYAYDDEELQKKIEIVGKGYQIQRYKGLGEMSAEQLWETTMDPARRNLIRVNIEDAAEAEQMVTALMGDRVEARKEFLAQNANFNKVDSFIDRVNI